MCFSGVCGKRGHLTYILMDRCGFSFSKARELLGDMFLQIGTGGSSTLPEFEQRKFKRRADVEYEKMEEIPAEILGVYDRCPVYMLNRGFTKSTLRQWDVGYDVERRRVTIPVWSKDRRLVGITKRAVDEDVEPRYKHLYFEKSRLLYGEHLVSDVTEAEPLIVVESQMSVLWLYQSGIRNAVSTLGSQVSLNQIERIAKYPWVVLAFDEDDAGRKATVRVLHGKDQLAWDPLVRRKMPVHEPGLVERVQRGRLKVVESYCQEGSKDFQEIPEELAAEVARGAVPWELWNLEEST